MQTNEYCSHCEEFNSIAHGICYSCGWNYNKNRDATITELEALTEKLKVELEGLRDGK